MKVLILSDTHFPFHSPRAFKEVTKAIKREKPDVVIQIGDLLDQYVFSKYSRSSKVTVEQDVMDGLAKARGMWANIKHMVPKAKCIQVLGNHDVRMSKRIQEQLPELAELFSPMDLYKFPGVKTLKSDRDFIIIDGVVYTHGWLSKSIDHSKYFGKPVVHGHRHRPAIETDGKLWTMDVGFLANEKSLPLSYTMSKHSKWRMAYGIVEDGKPRLVLL